MRIGGKSLTVAAAFACIIAGGAAPWTRLAYLIGADRAVMAFTSDEAVRGAVYYRQGLYSKADSAFAAVGRPATYNRAATLAATERYELSVAYYDAVLFANRYDEDAQANRDVVAEHVIPVIGESDGHGRIATIIEESGGNAKVDPDSPFGRILPTQRGVLKPVEARSVGASREWLDTLSDAPGTYLKQRLAAEYERRKANGVLNKPEASQW